MSLAALRSGPNRGAVIGYIPPAKMPFTEAFEVASYRIVFRLLRGPKCTIGVWRVCKERGQSDTPPPFPSEQKHTQVIRVLLHFPSSHSKMQDCFLESGMLLRVIIFHTLGAMQGLSRPDTRFEHLILKLIVFETLWSCNPTCKMVVPAFSSGPSGPPADTRTPTAVPALRERSYT